MRSLYPPIALALVAAVAAAPASATAFTYTFNTHLNSNSDAGPLTGSAAVFGGSSTQTGAPAISATISAWNANPNSSNVNGTYTTSKADLHEYAGGLGVTSKYDSYGNCGLGGCDMHQIDNVGNSAGTKSYDFVQIVFSQAVTLSALSRVAFATPSPTTGKYTVWDDDFAFGSGSTPLTAASTSASFATMLNNDRSSTGMCNAQYSLYGSSVCGDYTTLGVPTAATTWWISASLLNPDNYADAFKLYDFTVVYNTPTAPVPEPASWTMMIAGFGFIGSALRRKKATERLAAA